MEMRNCQASHNLKDTILIVIWLSIGGILFFQYGHINLLFPIILLGWIFVGVISWRLVQRRKIGNIVTLLLWVCVLCLPLSLIYLKYTSYQYDYALQEFILDASSVKDSSLEFSPYTDACDWHIWEEAFTSDYQARANDDFGIEVQWIVDFGNGSEYSIMMTPVSLRKWEVCVQPVR